jgi:hypothetical protein
MLVTTVHARVAVCFESVCICMSSLSLQVYSVPAKFAGHLFSLKQQQQHVTQSTLLMTFDSVLAVSLIV